MVSPQKKREESNVKNLKSKKWVGVVAMLLVAIALVPAMALAGTADTEFQPLFQKILDWTQGFLGKSLAVGAVLVGAGMAIYYQSAGPAVMGIAMALILAFGPGAIQGVVTATF